MRRNAGSCPQGNLTDAEGASDPICLRYLQDGGRTWAYVLNREPYEIPVSFTFGAHARAATMPPFGLRMFETGGISVPSEIVCDIAPSVQRAYAAEAERALLKGRRHISGRIRAALDAGAYATLRHLLLCYHVRLAILQKGEL